MIFMSEINVNKLEIIVVFDIGIIKICVIVGCWDEYGKIEVLGFGKVVFEGVLCGVVLNIEKIVKAIVEVVNMV